MRSPLAALVIAALTAVVGCRNQSSTLTNPFLTPDRVPPPSTRVLAPGTAQPFYPGDPAPGGVVGAPPAAVTAPGTAFPQGSPFPPANVAPLTPTAPPTTAPLTTPPGGWGAYAPQSQAAPVTPGIAPTTFGQATPAAFPPNAGAQSPLGAGAPQQLQMREVTPAEYLAPQVASTPATTPTRDGFRPQSGAPRPDDSSSQSFRPPEIRRDSVDPAAASDQFAVGENYQTLRGQLEYWPETGQWTVRYLPAGSPADSIGGRVIVDNPQVLANLQPGELVAVSGQLYAQPADDGTAKPAYRVATVQRQRQ